MTTVTLLSSSTNSCVLASASSSPCLSCLLLSGIVGQLTKDGQPHSKACPSIDPEFLLQSADDCILHQRYQSCPSISACLVSDSHSASSTSGSVASIYHPQANAFTWNFWRFLTYSGTVSYLSGADLGSCFSGRRSSCHPKNCLSLGHATQFYWCESSFEIYGYALSAYLKSGKYSSCHYGFCWHAIDWARWHGIGDSAIR